ncbi:MAG: cytochrome c3 family protein [Geobacteraceae bacterium]|nr:cytochrome c3 family protein [Geobacteraceae bacterium]
MKPLRFLLLALILLLPTVSLAKETKDISFSFKNAEAVIFSHDFHLEKYNNNCRICHNAIFNLKSKTKFTMADMEKTKSCGACHSGVKAFSVKNEKDCTKCHKGKPKTVTFKVKGATDVAFSHDSHVSKAGLSCKSCHDGKIITGKDKNVSMAQMEKGRTCGACHNGKRAFTVAGNCGNCHKGMSPREITFKLKGVTDAVFSHQVHIGMFKCPDCHTKVFPYKAGSLKATMASMETGKSCGTCHNGKDAFTVAGECDKCHKGYKPGIIPFKTEAGDASFSHEFHLGMFKCADCHTKVFPFKAGALKAKMGDMDKGKSCGACHNGKDAFKTEDCIKCHKM